MNEPVVSVGILIQPTITFVFHGEFGCTPASPKVQGVSTASFQDGMIEWEGAFYDELVFSPLDPANAFFEIQQVIIGINFHWERKEDQQFFGGLKIMVDGDNLVAINLIGVESYLTSVISSEMSATSSLELLKAHAVISRSWLLAQVEKAVEVKTKDVTYASTVRTKDSLIRWYDREDHTLFDVCADDHCQRYQGIIRQNETVEQAVHATWGELLEYDGMICDARFSKSCGGITELFQNCWEPVDHPYLKVLRDAADDDALVDLTIEANAEQWIRSAPPAFCNTHDHAILDQVLNNYDQETTDFYRWTVSYSQEKLSQLITMRTGIDFGDILALIPVERGPSGRLIRLKIVGTKQTLIIGKELEIRKTLSTSHLYSSAFVVDTFDLKEDVPQRFLLTGAGWGHGVGLCQIGAAVMGAQGYNYHDILLHYFRGASIVKRY
jgi:SpoIID/LytB domain protein